MSRIVTPTTSIITTTTTIMWIMVLANWGIKSSNFEGAGYR